MHTPTLFAALLALGFSGSALAQGCSCDATGTRTANSAALAQLLANKMVCVGTVGNWQSQEWHNGTSSGPVVDYKRGPGHPVDPPTPVGEYSVGLDNTVTYTYTGQSFTYQVCLASGGGSYSFCGPSTVTGVKIGGAGLANCDGVTNAVNANTARSTRDVRTPVIKTK